MTTKSDILTELNKITPMAEKFSQQTPYQVPVGYFNQFADTLLHRIKADEELEMLSPLLRGLSRKAPFTAPEGYFENLAPQLSNNGNIAEPPAKVVQGSFGKRLFRYSAAAAIAGILFMATWIYLKEPATTVPVLAKNEVMQNELLQKAMKISEKEISAYLDSSAIAPIYETTDPSEVIREEDALLMLSDISVEELQYFLEQDDFIKPSFN